jgi:RNA polymerase sigma-70 factor (ECF subfamily)
MSREEESEEEAAEDSPLFQRALALIQGEFEEKTWRAFWAVVIDGKKPRETGKELGMSEGAVRVAKCRVLQRLRLELGDLNSN